MRLLGLDIGKKRIGVAVTDPLGIMATPVVVIKRVSIAKDVADIVSLAEEYEVEKIVSGMPMNMDGTSGAMVLYVEKFLTKLRQETTVEVVLWDERLSTVAVERVLIEGDVSRAKRREVVDKLSAAYILQGYLDAQKNSAPNSGRS